MEDEEEEDGPCMGKRPKEIKQANILNEPRRERERKRKAEQDGAMRGQVEQQGQDQPQEAHQEQDRAMQGQVEQQGQDQPQEAHQEQIQPESKIPIFGDGSRILKDWTTLGLIGDPIMQHEDTCGSIVFTRLLQVAYNRDKPIASHRVLSHRDLAEHIRGRTKKTEFSFRNMNIPINYIRKTGLHKDDKISGPGVKTKGDFGQQHEATKHFIYDMLEVTPLGIVVEVSVDLENVGLGIYQVPAVRTETTSEHAMIVVARGITNCGIEFLVVQNSWGIGFGNNGYCRLFLPEDGRFKIYWPL